MRQRLFRICKEISVSSLTKIATDTFKILKQVVNSDGGIEEAVLKSIIDKIRQESGISAEVPADRLVDLSILREVRAELRKR